MSEASQNISVELPEHLLKKLGDDPSSKIRELLEKYVETEPAPLLRCTAP